MRLMVIWPRSRTCLPIRAFLSAKPSLVQNWLAWPGRLNYARRGGPGRYLDETAGLSATQWQQARQRLPIQVGPWLINDESFSKAESLVAQCRGGVH